MARDYLTDSEVELEIDRLLNSEHVQLAKKEIRLKYKRRQYMYQLRWMEKRGKQLAAEGTTLETLDAMLSELDNAEKACEGEV